MGAQNQGGGQSMGSYQPPQQPTMGGGQGKGGAQPVGGNQIAPTAQPSPANPPMQGQPQPWTGWGGGMGGWQPSQFKPMGGDMSPEAMAHASGQNYQADASGNLPTPQLNPMWGNGGLGGVGGWRGQYKPPGSGSGKGGGASMNSQAPM